MRMTHIYALLHPTTSEIRYVGKTVNTLTRRLSRHINDATKNKHHTAKWINSLTKEGLRPTVIEIEQVDLDWVDAECFWISYFKSIGANLTNHSIGGDGVPGLRWSKESCAKLSKTLTGRKLSEEHKLKVSQGLKGRVFSEEHKQNLRKSALGKKMSLEACEKMRQNNLGRVFTQEHRDKISIGLKRFKNSLPSLAE